MSDEIEVVGTYSDTEEHESLTDQNSLVSQNGSLVDEIDAATKRKKHWRNLLSFWLLGLTNNFAYVVMLSAAHDILSQDFNGGGGGGGGDAGGGNGSVTPGNDTNTTNPRDCNTISTGAVLLADIIPSLLMKLWAPFIFLHIHGRVSLVVVLGTCSFLLVGLATSRIMAIFGVICAAAGAGLGEVSFLSYSANYHENVVSTWSSGTGAAGVFGAVTFAVLTSAGLTPRTSVLIMLVVPLIMSVSFWVILTHPVRTKCRSPCMKYGSISEEEEESMLPSSRPSPPLTFSQKMNLLPSLMKYMIPVFMVYLAEYVINQGLLELVYFPEDRAWLDHHEQYRWYQVIYQVGVMVSRSSVNFVHINHIWKTSVLQWINVVLFLTCAIYWWIKNIWLVFFLIFWEGLLGGAAYVNTFYRVSQEISEPHKEYAMGVTTLADSFGITVAGLIAIPIHNAICSLPVK